MERINIHTNREKTIQVSNFINANRSKIYLGKSKSGSTNYYDVNGVVWSCFHEGTGPYPETNGVLTADFMINNYKA